MSSLLSFFVCVLGVLTVLPFCLYLHIRLSPKNSLHVTSISRLRHTTNQFFHSITDLTLRSLRSLARSPSPHLPLSYFNSSVPHLSRRCLRTPRIGFFRYTSRPTASHFPPPVLIGKRLLRLSQHRQKPSPSPLTRYFRSGTPKPYQYLQSREEQIAGSPRI